MIYIIIFIACTNAFNQNTINYFSKLEERLFMKSYNIPNKSTNFGFTIIANDNCKTKNLINKIEKTGNYVQFFSKKLYTQNELNRLNKIYIQDGIITDVLIFKVMFGKVIKHYKNIDELLFEIST